MKQRCYNSNARNWEYYGGRDISVCDEWLTSFPTFLMDMGEKPSPEFQLDRIDNNKGYCKENCRWISPKENTRNRRSNVGVTINGETKCIIEWCEEYGIKRTTFVSRLKRGLQGEELLKPPRSSSKDITE